MLAHERAHLRARHDLVLIPFTSLRRTFPRSAVITQAYRTVALLVEMMADDRALRVRGLFARNWPPRCCGSARLHAQCPAGALSAAEGELTARVNRLLAPPPPLCRAAQAVVVLSAAALVLTPLLLLAMA